LLSVADIVQIEKYSLSVYVSKSKDLKMEKVKDHLFCNASFEIVNKSTVLSKHVEQRKSKALHGQWPKLMEELAADSFRWAMLILNQ